MTVSPERKGYEISRGVKNRVKERSEGTCEWALGCGDPGIYYDHLTSIRISRLLNNGIPDKSVKSFENTQLLCDWHNNLKTFIESWMVNQLEKQISA